MSKAATTRSNILQKAYELIYTKGYQTTSIDDIIATTHVTKGAFYYHFKNKEEMGIAVINEVMRPAMIDNLAVVLSNSADPVKDLYQMMQFLLLESPLLQLEHGCPAGNLTQEMAPWNKAFSEALSQLIDDLQMLMQQCLDQGKKKTVIRADVDAEQVTFFLMSGYWGIRTLGKLYNDKKYYNVYLKELSNYLETLK